MRGVLGVYNFDDIICRVIHMYLKKQKTHEY